ncbi:SMI1/KNR4 family protein [Streptomyces sp. G44]|uniref:SMI1/KNR4 family protein n=1 Tax=Streptomyces sp. G44 TaxID=2807632 RepID=UPI001960A957|nr:SMI1/KNR4 family protein [Streptomyces sp. G44]MBM7170139.1 SMI1/KNR4 family protein [Streptomyces sp. G44]
MEVADSWAMIESWLMRHAPAEKLANGASSTELDELQDNIWVPIPHDLRSSLECHNGSGGAEVIPPSFVFWEVGEILAEYGTEPFQRERIYIPIGAMGPNRLVIDSQSNILARYDPHYGFYSRDEKAWCSTLSDMLALVADEISRPSSTLRFSEDEVWEATTGHGPCAGFLVWEDV